MVGTGPAGQTAGVALDATCARQCPVRTQLRLAPPPGTLPAPRTAADQDRRDALHERAAELLDRVTALPGAVDAEGSLAVTARLLGRGPGADLVPDVAGSSRAADVVVRPAFPAEGTRREGAPHALIGVGAGPTGYLPLLVKAHQVTERTRSPRAVGMRSSTVPELAALAGHADLDHLVPDPAHRPRPDHGRADGLELAHHWRRLEELGLTPPGVPPTGGVLDASGTVWWFDLATPRYSHAVLAPAPARTSLLAIHDHEFAERVRIADHTIARLSDATLPPAVTPVRIGECKTCPWYRTACRPWLAERDHVSLLPGQASRARVALHAERGVRTRADLAALGGDDPRYADVELRPALPDLVDEARAVTSRRPWRRRSSTPAALRADLPVHAVEVDIDMENGPGGAAYLWGLWVTRPHLGPGRSEPEYIALDDYRRSTPEVHLALTRRLAEQLHALRHEAAMAGGTLALYHWSPAEFRPLVQLYRTGALTESTLRRLGVDRAGSSVRGPEWVDLERVWKRHVLTGGRSSLKSVVYVVDPGFDYEVDAPGGDHSQAWYLRAVADLAGDRATAFPSAAAEVVPATSEAVRWLRTYNRSDVRATALIRHWMRTTLPALPSIARWSPAAHDASRHPLP